MAGSTGVTALVGAGSGDFRYNSSSTATNYYLPLGSTGIYAIYREQPTLTITADSYAITYGDTPPVYAVTVSGQNGDTAAQALSTGGYGYK